MTLRLLVLWIALVVAAPGHAAPGVNIDAALKQWQGEQAGGVAAAWIDTGGVTFFNTGTFDTGDARPVTPDTQFEIGSVTKVFTALLLADTLREGKVKLADIVGAPFGAGAVTYQQLATHTSGLPRMPADFVSSDPLNPYAEETIPVMVKSFDAVAAGLKPAPSSYSNFGFAVLGQALAAVWAQPYEAVLAQRVLQPLGLRDTVLSWRLADPKRLAPPHSGSGPGRNWDLNAFSPAGSLVSTSRDLARLVQACLGLTSTALQEALAETMRPHAPGDAPARQIGLAWQIEQRGASQVIWHNGATGGYHSFVAFDLAKKAGLVLIVNQARGLEGLGFSLLAGQLPPAPRASVAPAASLKEFLGNYPLAPSFVMAVTAEGDQLYVQATNQPRLTLQSISADRYGVKGVAAEVSFERDSAGKIIALILHQNGMNQRAPRTAPGEKSPAPPLPAEVTLTQDELDGYVGRYRLGPMEFTVKHEESRLLVQLTGQPFAPVFASAKDEFSTRSSTPSSVLCGVQTARSRRWSCTRTGAISGQRRNKRSNWR